RPARPVRTAAAAGRAARRAGPAGLNTCGGPLPVGFAGFSAGLHTPFAQRGGLPQFCGPGWAFPTPLGELTVHEGDGRRPAPPPPPSPPREAPPPPAEKANPAPPPRCRPPTLPLPPPSPAPESAPRRRLADGAPRRRPPPLLAAGIAGPTSPPGGARVPAAQ